MNRTYEEQMGNGVVCVVTFADNEIRYSVTKNVIILYNEAIIGRYSTRRAAQLAREQYEVATRSVRDTGGS